MLRLLAIRVCVRALLPSVLMSLSKVRAPYKCSVGCRCRQTWSGPLPTMLEACKSGNEPAVKELLRRGADVNASLNVSAIGGDMLCRSGARHVRRLSMIGIVVARTHICKQCTHACMFTPERPHLHTRMHHACTLHAHTQARGHPVTYLHINSYMYTCTCARTQVFVLCKQACFLISAITRALVHICTGTHAHMHKCAHAPFVRCTCTHAHKKTCPPSRLHGRAFAHMRACTLALAFAPHSQSRTLIRVHARMHPCIHERFHAQPCTYMLTRTRDHAHSYTVRSHVDTHTRKHLRSLRCKRAQLIVCTNVSTCTHERARGTTPLFPA